MKRFDLCYHFTSSLVIPVFIVSSSVCGFCLIVSPFRQISRASATFFFDFCLTHISINMNNACTTVDKGLVSTKHSPQLCWCYSCIES